jgi:hypothetical protein
MTVLRLAGLLALWARAFTRDKLEAFMVAAIVDSMPAGSLRKLAMYAMRQASTSQRRAERVVTTPTPRWA